MKRYCKNCKKETNHRELNKSLIADLAVALITKFSVDLRSPDYECNQCGKKCDE